MGYPSPLPLPEPFAMPQPLPNLAHQMAQTLRDVASDHHPHTGHRPEGRNLADCTACMLEHVADDIEVTDSLLQRYREAGALSSLEVMPSPIAVRRLAAWLVERFGVADGLGVADGSDYHRDDTGAWEIEAQKCLRIATGLGGAATPPQADAEDDEEFIGAEADMPLKYETTTEYAKRMLT